MSKIIVAIDANCLEDAVQLVEQLAPHDITFKIGLELTTAVGVPAAVKAIKNVGGQVFLDLKLHDIPNTMAGAARAALDQGVDMLNVHCSAGLVALKAVRALGSAYPNCKLLGVSVLTSLSTQDCLFLFHRNAEQMVDSLAELTKDAGLHGLICSPLEISIAKEYGLLTVVPGIRPHWAASNDQQRFTTPSEAVKLGADYQVIGRPITKPPAQFTPRTALESIQQEIAACTTS